MDKITQIVGNIVRKKNRWLKLVVEANPGLVGKKCGTCKNDIYPIVAFYIIVKCQRLLRCFSRYRFMMRIAFFYGINRQIKCFKNMSLN